jgi:hypothetical protein
MEAVCYSETTVWTSSEVHGVTSQKIVIFKNKIGILDTKNYNLLLFIENWE